MKLYASNESGSIIITGETGYLEIIYNTKLEHCTNSSFKQAGFFIPSNIRGCGIIFGIPEVGELLEFTGYCIPDSIPEEGGFTIFSITHYDLLPYFIKPKVLTVKRSSSDCGSDMIFLVETENNDNYLLIMSCA